jgi:hypothetical protein
MTVRDAINEIRRLERNLNLIDQARRQGFDVDVTEAQIDATNQRIEDLYNLDIPGARVRLEQVQRMRQLKEAAQELIKAIED